MGIKILIAALMISVVFGTGYKLAYWKAEAQWQEALNNAHEEAAKLQAKFNRMAKKFLAHEQKVVEKIKIQEKEVIKYVEATGDRECLDAAGIELFNQISTAAVSDTADLP